MGEILNGKNATITELSLPKTSSTTEQLDNTTPYMQVLDFSVASGPEIIEHQLVGDDKKVFDAGVQNATVTMTILMEALYGTNTVPIYTILEMIRQYPVSVDADATTDRYYIKIVVNNAAASNVAGMVPSTGSQAACEVSDISYPANDSIRFTLTIRYGQLEWTDGA